MGDFLDPDLVAAARRQASTSIVSTVQEKENEKVKEKENEGFLAQDGETGTGSTETSLKGDQGQSSSVLSGSGSDVGSLRTETETIGKKEKVLLKIVVVGAAASGKSSIMKRFVSGRFVGERRPTIGADFMTKTLVLGSDTANIQIWDTAGQERFHNSAAGLGAGFYRGASAAVIVFDVTYPKSWDQVPMWREAILTNVGVTEEEEFPIMCLANKVDLDLAWSGIDNEKVAGWCSDHGIGLLETSAKDGSGVDAAMQAVAMLALDEHKKRERLGLLRPEALRLMDKYQAKSDERGPFDCCNGG